MSERFRWRSPVWIVGALTALVVTSALVAKGSIASPGVDVRINADAAGTVQNEIRIAQNPSNANNLIVAYNDLVGASSSPVGVSYSVDAGVTWTDTQLGIPLHPVLGTPLGVIFDPYIDPDSQGDVFAGYIATDGSSSGASGIYIERSQNGGAAWSGPTTIAFDLPATGPIDPTYRFNDRPDITVDGTDDVHVVWIKDVGVGLPTSDIYFAKSPPPGPTSPANPTGLDFTGLGLGSVAPQTVNDGANGTDRANAPDVAVAPDGTVYVAWIDVDVTDPNPKPATLRIDRSTTGGTSFGSDVNVAPITALANHLSTASGSGDDARSGSYPAIAVDPSNSQTVYIAYAADPAGPDEADLFFIRSTDGGASWSSPLRVNDDTTTNDQLHPAIAAGPAGITIAWYDKRNSPGDSAWDVYTAQSANGGASFAANVRITDQSFGTPTNAPGTEPWLGEYLGLEVDAVRANVAFTSSTSDAKGDVFFDSVVFSPPTPPPTPTTITTTTTTTPGPTRCDITGTSGADVLVGTSRSETICSLQGPDRVRGRRGNDHILLGAGRDLGRGGRGADTLRGAKGADRLIGGRGIDRAHGGPARDRCRTEITHACER